jgi:hypothetical protein
MAPMAPMGRSAGGVFSIRGLIANSRFRSYENSRALPPTSKFLSLRRNIFDQSHRAMKQLSIGLLALLSTLRLSAQPSECFSLYLSAASGQPGQTVCLQVTADGLADLLSMQFSMRWEPQALRFVGIEDLEMPGLQPENFNTLPASVNNGFLTLNWFDLTFAGLSLPDGSPLFSVCFEILEAPAAQHLVRFSSAPTPIEFIRVPEQVVTAFGLVHGRVSGVGPGQPLSIASACALYGDCVSGGHSITVAVQGGQPPYAYAWLSGGQLVSSAPSLSGDFSGTFELLVEDAAGHQATAFFNLTPESVPYVLGAEIKAASCAQPDDGYILLQLSDQPPGLALVWSNGAVGTNVFGLVPGQYSVTVSMAGSECAYTLNFAVPLEDCEGQPTLRIGDGAAAMGSTHCLPVYAADLEGLDSLRLAISWDPAGLALSNLQPSLIGLAGFDLSAAGDGRLLLDWKSPGPPLQIASEAELFRLCFELTGAPPQVFPIIFDDGLQTPRAYDAQGQAFDGLLWQNGSIFIQTPSADAGLRLSVSSHAAFFGQPICADIFAEGFDNIVGGQFSLRWPADSLRFDSIVFGLLPNLSSLNFNLNETEQGFLRFQWLDQALAGVSLPDSSVLFSACFTAGSEPGNSLVQIAGTPTAIEFVSGTNVIPVETVPGLISIQPPAVWPGDANADGRADHFDLLPIGLAFGASGPERPAASLQWAPQAAPEWPQQTPVSEVNYRHIDTDGNGLVEAADTLALALNWGRSAFPAPSLPLPPLLEAPIFVQSDTAAPAQALSLDLWLGEAGQGLLSAYGLAFTIAYDAEAIVPGSLFLRADNSWLGQPGAGLLEMSRSRPTPGRLDAALVRTDGLDASGTGPIAQLHFQIKDSAFSAAPDYYEMVFQIENARLIDREEAIFRLSTPPSTVWIAPLPSSTRAQGQVPEVRIFPVPARETVFLHSPHAAIWRAELFAPDGRWLAAYQQPREIAVGGLPPGLYWLRLYTERGLSVQRLVVGR